MLNLGQLAREEAGRGNVVLTGFGTFMGTVIASREWGEQMERMLVPPAIAGSLDQFLHESNDGHPEKNKRLLTFVDTKLQKMFTLTQEAREQSV